MSQELGRTLFETGRSHALASCLLYRSAVRDAEVRGLEDPQHFAFNGTYSLSTQYLLGLGLELMLKSAIVGWGGPADDQSLRAIGHDLLKALRTAEDLGFRSRAPNLRDIVNSLQEPFKQHWLRYQHPSQFSLPANFLQVEQNLLLFDKELQDRFWRQGTANAG